MPTIQCHPIRHLKNYRQKETEETRNKRRKKVEECYVGQLLRFHRKICDSEGSGNRHNLSECMNLK